MQGNNKELSLEHPTPFWRSKQNVSGGQTGVDRASLDWIISGGQIGVDRAALYWAIKFGIRYGIKQGGWCPKNRKAEDGPINNCYRLQETPSDKYPLRTEWNVMDSDGTVVFSIEEKLSDGSAQTRDFAEQHHKPFLHIHKESVRPAVRLLNFLSENNIRVLNIAGPRGEGTESKVGKFVVKVLDETFAM